MKNLFSKVLSLLCAGILYHGPTYGQKSMAVNDYVTVTMDLQGILELKMSTNPQVDFVFNDLKKYQDGIVKHNATVLEVNATVNWDLYVQPSTQYWSQEAKYSSNIEGLDLLPSEILELKSYPPNNTPTGNNLNDFIGLASYNGTNVGTTNPGQETQFISGGFDRTTNENRVLYRTSNEFQYATKFSIDYRIKPGLPATFPSLAKKYPDVASTSFAGYSLVQPGYYVIEVVYTLTQDL